MNTCKPQKISQLDNTNCLLPNDIIPVVQKGTNRTISAKNLIDQIINRIKDILPGSSEAMCIAVEAKKLAEQASADATQALKNLANALAYATKAYQLACQMDSRIQALEGDHALIIELQDALALLTRQVNINTQRINDIINSNILKITTDADNNYTTYTFYVDNRKIGEIKVPKPKEYTGSQYIDINEERVISLTGLANVAFTGDYTDLSNRPTKLTDFYIDIDFLKESDLKDIEDKITNLQECCEELHTKYFKLINQLEENTQNIVYTIKVDNTRYVVPYDSTWDDIKIPSGSHTIEIAVNEESFIEDYPVLSYNYVTETPMTKKNTKGTLWGASLKKINSNVILKGKIWSSQANGTLKVYDVDTNTLLFNSADVIAARPYTTTIYAPEGQTFLANVEINNLFPSSLNAKVTYKSGSNIELTLSNPTKDNIIYIRGLESEDSSIAENMYPIILAAEGPGSLSSDYNYYEQFSDTFPTPGVMIYVNYNSPQTYAHNIIVKFNDENGENVPQQYWEGISTTKLNKIHLQTTAIISDNIAAPIYVKIIFYTPDPVMHTLSLSNNIKDYASVSPTTFEQGKAFTATVTPNSGYTIYQLKLLDYKGRYIPAFIDGNTIDVHWDFALRDLTVDGQIVPNYLPVVNNANIYNNIPNSTCNLSTTPIGERAVITITPLDGYQIVVKDNNNNDKIIIENNGVTETNAIITSHTADYGVDITIPTVNGDIVINGESIQLRYTASLGTNLKKITGASISPTEGTIGENREFTITLPNTYELTAITSVTEDNSTLIINNTTKVVINGNKVTVKNIAGDIVIDGTATKPAQNNQLFAQFLDGGTIFGASHLQKDATVLYATAKSTAGYGSIRTQLNVSEYAGGQFPTKGPWQIEYKGARAYSIEDTASGGNRPTNWIDTITAPTISEISPTSGTGVQEITFTVPENNTAAKIFHEFTITQGVTTKSLYLYQQPSSRAAAWASKGFEFSPYSAGKTIQLKFNNDWRIVQPTDSHLNYFSAILSGKAGTQYEIADRNNTEDYTIMYHTDKLLSDDLTIEGTKNDTLTIICNTDVDPTWSSYNSTTAWWELPVFYINEGPKTGFAYTSAYPIHFKHDFNNANESTISHSMISLVDHEYTGGTDDSNTKYYIKSVKVDNNIVYSGTATDKVTQSILGYRKGANIEVEIGDIHGQTVSIPNDKINVYYGAYKYQDSLLPATEGIYGDGIVWTQGLSLTAFDGKTVKFVADSGIIVPNNESSDNEKTWTYQIVIQQ